MVGDVERVLAALNGESVRYLVAGGVAVVLHGYLRTTADLDLIIGLETDNVRRALLALDSLGYRPRAPVTAGDFADRSIRESWIREKNLQVFSMWSNLRWLETTMEEMRALLGRAAPEPSEPAERSPRRER